MSSNLDFGSSCTSELFGSEIMCFNTASLDLENQESANFSNLINETICSQIAEESKTDTFSDLIKIAVSDIQISSETEQLGSEINNKTLEIVNNTEILNSEIVSESKNSEEIKNLAELEKHNIKPCYVKLTKLKLKSNSKNTTFKLIPIKNNLTKKIIKNKNIIKTNKLKIPKVAKPVVQKTFIKEYKACFICTKCKIKFRRRKRFNYHVLKLHKDVPIKNVLKILLECIVCKLLFCNAENITTHLCKPKQGNHVEIRKYYCSTCNIEFSTYTSCATHITLLHSDVGKTIVRPKLMYQCDACFVLLEDNYVDMHNCKNIMYKCNKCPSTLKNKMEYDLHISTAHISNELDIQASIATSMSNLLKVFDIDTNNDDIDLNLNTLANNDNNLIQNMIANNTLDNSTELNDILITDNIFSSDSNLLGILQDDDNTNCSSLINEIEPMDTDINEIEPSYSCSELMNLENSISQVESLNAEDSQLQSNDSNGASNNSVFYLVVLPLEEKEKEDTTIAVENHDPRPIRHNTELELKKMPCGQKRKAKIVDDRILAANMKFRTFSYCYHCIACNVSFQSMETFKSHSSNIHKGMKKAESSIFQKLIDCDKCELSFQYYELFANHVCNSTLSMFVNIIFYYCALCPLVFNSFKLCKSHIQKEHSLGDFSDRNIKIKQTQMCQCRNCFKLFVTRKKLKNHRYSSCSDNWCLHCSCCHLSFATHQNLQAHIIDCHFEQDNSPDQEEIRSKEDNHRNDEGGNTPTSPVKEGSNKTGDAKDGKKCAQDELEVVNSVVERCVPGTDKSGSVSDVQVKLQNDNELCKSDAKLVPKVTNHEEMAINS